MKPTPNEVLKKIGSLFNNPAEAEKMIFERMEGASIANSHGWDIWRLLVVHEHMYNNRVKYGTPHDVKILKGHLDSIQNLVSGGHDNGVTKKPGWAKMVG